MYYVGGVLVLQVWYVWYCRLQSYHCTKQTRLVLFVSPSLSNSLLCSFFLVTCLNDFCWNNIQGGQLLLAVYGEKMLVALFYFSSLWRTVGLSAGKMLGLSFRRTVGSLDGTTLGTSLG